MTKQRLALFSTSVALLTAMQAGPAAAAKRINFEHGAACQPKKNSLGLLPAISYVSSGVIVDALSADLICPVPWSKEGLSTWDLLDKVDITVDWLGLPSTNSVLPISPNWGCTLVYESSGGSLYMQSLPVPYPLPSTLTHVAYMALWCTVPQSMGVQGYSINMCFTSTGSPGACAPPTSP
jgi:hypothetical protein